MIENNEWMNEYVVIFLRKCLNTNVVKIVDENATRGRPY